MTRGTQDRSQLISDEMEAVDETLFIFFSQAIGSDDPADKKVQDRVLRTWRQRKGFERYNMPALLLYLVRMRGVNLRDVHVSIKCASPDTRRLARAIRDEQQDLLRRVERPDEARVTTLT